MALFSQTLYHVLDCLGYSDDVVKFRREIWKYETDLFSTYISKGTSRCITAGSKGEGLTSVLESDVDRIYLFSDIICTDDVDTLSGEVPHPRMPVFLADMSNVPPGYTRLKLCRSSHSISVTSIDPDIRKCLFESETGDVYLSSTFWTSLFKSLTPSENGMTSHEVKGPSIPISAEFLAEDHVIGFSIDCPQFLKSWASRPRQHEWPFPATIELACSFLPQVVPVGAKGSDRQFQEWRFCFIESELALVHSFNGTQKKLFILLKMIAKSILKQVTVEITSYVMKNVTFWLSELLPLHVFKEDKLVSLVLLALAFLRTAISRWQALPYYMIPSRDLLSERFDARTRSELSDVLSGLLHEGPRLLLRIENLRICLESACRRPSDTVKYGIMRDQVEKNALAYRVLDILKTCGVKFDESITGNLLFSSESLVVSHLCSVYPWRHGNFSAEEIIKAKFIALS